MSEALKYQVGILRACLPDLDEIESGITSPAQDAALRRIRGTVENLITELTDGKPHEAYEGWAEENAVFSAAKRFYSASGDEKSHADLMAALRQLWIVETGLKDHE